MSGIYLFAVFLLAYVLTGCVRKFALATQLLDHPTPRSSHVTPTPRGGGLAIVVASILGWVSLAVAGVVDVALATALSGGGVLVAVIGFIDDRSSLSVRVRIAVQLIAAIWAIYCLDGMPRVQVGERTFDYGMAGDVMGVVGIVWVLNLFNFMDGIDGIAASEAVFVNSAGALICILIGSLPAVPATALVLAAASLGFLVWNWPPAKIFMGDVGSGYLGYAIAVIAIAAARENSVGLFIWMTLGGLFFVDATVTLIRRLLSGERLYAAHRTHAYQRLARRGRGHLRVTVGVWILNCCWLLPGSWLAALYPKAAIWIVGIVLAPIVALAILSSAGKKEDESR